MYYQARNEFQNGQYSQAIQHFERFLTTYPKSSFEIEAQWFLARSYHESGDVSQAIDQYRLVASRPQSKRYHPKALRYIDTLESLSTLAVRHKGEVLAVHLSLEQILHARDWNVTLQKMKRRGVTTQLMRVECRPSKQAIEFLLQQEGSARSTKVSTLEGFPAFVQQAHQQGIDVFIGINLRCLGWLNAKANVHFADRAYDQVTRRLRPTNYFDIFNSAYQVYMKKVVSQLAELKIDGIVLLADTPLGLYEGLTPTSISMFERTFQIPFHPQKVFRPESFNRSSPMMKAERGMGSPSLPKDPVYWRWIGWRVRERLTVLQQLKDGIKRRDPQLQVALEVHARTLHDPIEGLARYTEDLLELQQKDFAFFLIGTHGEWNKKVGFEGSQLVSQENLRNLAKRFLDLTKDPTKIWLTLPISKTREKWSSESLSGLSRDANLPQGMGVVYDLRSYS